MSLLSRRQVNVLWRASPRTSAGADAGVEQGERKTHLHEAGLATCHRRRLPSSVAVEVSPGPCLCLNNEPSQGTISQTGRWFSHHVFNKGDKSAFTHTLTNKKSNFLMLKTVFYLCNDFCPENKTKRTRLKKNTKNPIDKPIEW